MTLDEQIAALVETASRLGLGPDELASQINIAFDDLQPVEDDIPLPTDFEFITTPLSRELMPGEWIWTNLQRKPGSVYIRPMSHEDEMRICLNVGCDGEGELRPAAFRGFEQAGSVQAEARLRRHSATSFLFDIRQTKFGWALDTDKPVGKIFGTSPTKNAIYHAVRCADDDALDEWVRWVYSVRNSPDSPQ